MVDIEKIEKRTVRSFYEDGFTEIVLGLLFVILGGYFVAQDAAPAGSALKDWLTAAFVLIAVSAGFFVNRLLRFFKHRVTYPRAGFVALKKKDPGRGSRLATAVVAMIISACLAALYGLSPSFRALYPAVNGLLFAVAILFVASRIGLLRFFMLAAASAIIGVSLAAAGIGGFKGLTLFYLLIGAAGLISGLGALLVFLRRNPRPAADANPFEGPDVR